MLPNARVLYCSATGVSEVGKAVPYPRQSDRGSVNASCLWPLQHCNLVEHINQYESSVRVRNQVSLLALEWLQSLHLSNPPPCNATQSLALPLAPILLKPHTQVGNMVYMARMGL
jgi:hypothetical protein